MKKLILGAALTALLAAPALAQPYHATHGMSHYDPSQATLHRLRGIRAQAMPLGAYDAVYNDGQYVGADPDPNVRLQMDRTAPAGSH